MAVAYRTPGVYVDPPRPAPPPLERVRTDIAGFVGLAARGPGHAPVALDGWNAFVRTFGPPVPGGYLAAAVFGFFENGGRRCHVVRVYRDAAARAAEGTLLSRPLHGAPEGRPALAVRAASAGTWADGLELRAAPTALGRSRVTAVAGDGRWVRVQPPAGFFAGSLIRLVPGTADPAEAGQAFRRVLGVEGDRLVLDRPYRPAAGADTVPRAESLEFDLEVWLGGRPAERYYGLSPGEEHPRSLDQTVNAVSAFIRLELSAEPLFDHQRVPRAQTAVLAGGADGLDALLPDDFLGSPDGGPPRGLEALAAVADVGLVAVPDVAALRVPAPGALPVPEPRPEPPPPPEDSCGCPVEEAAPAGAAGRPGVDPGAGGSPWPGGSPGPGGSGGAGEGGGVPYLTPEAQDAVRQGLLEHCERLADRFALLDPPPGLDPYAALTWRAGFDSSYGAVYYPWLRVAEPGAAARGVGAGGAGRRGAGRWIPPSGHVAGVIARTDLARGVHQAPANEPVRGAMDLAVRVDRAEQDLLNPAGVNCVRAFSGRGLLVWGARTLSSDPQWRYVSVRRLVIMIRRAITDAMPWAVFEPHDRRLRLVLTGVIQGFLTDLWQAGALAGTGPEEAFLVKCDDETNPPDVVEAGQLVVEVRVAPVRPAEFVVLRVSATPGGIRVEEL